MPRILRIINRFNLGGPTYNVSYLTKHLSSRFETMLVGGMKDESEESSLYIPREMGIEPVIISEMKREINFRDDRIAFNKLKKLIEAYKPDIVHTHAAKAGALGRLAAIQLKVPVIIHTYHGHVFHSYFGKAKTTVFKYIERYLAGRTTGIVAISDKQKEELTSVHNIAPPSRVHVIPLGFDLDRFNVDQIQKRKLFREKYKISENEMAIGIIGRLVPVKNHTFFLKAIKHLAEKTDINFRAIIIGDGESKNNIAEKVSEMNLEDRIIFTSWIKDIDQAYAGLDIITLTSFNEGTPVSLIEAQAAGKPVVSTRVGGIENVVLHGTSGFLCDIDQAGEFYTYLEKLMKNPDICKDFGNKGKAFVRSRYSYIRMVNEMENLYTSLLQGV